MGKSSFLVGISLCFSGVLGEVGQTLGHTGEEVICRRDMPLNI